MIQKIGTVKEFHMNYQDLVVLPNEVQLKIQEIVSILDEAYGSERNVLQDLGGFVQVVKTTSQWREFVKDNCIDKELYEVIENINGQYVYLLYLKSDDYSIAVIAPKDIVNIELRYE